jgi:hypothetical protein
MNSILRIVVSQMSYPSFAFQPFAFQFLTDCHGREIFGGDFQALTLGFNSRFSASSFNLSF